MNLYTRYLIPTTLLIVACVCNGEKFMKVHRLSDLTQDQRQEIFTTTYHDNAGKSAKHDIKLLDEFGKYFRLEYESKHGSNTNILKLNEPHHENNIESLLCSLDDPQNEFITLHFKSHSVAQQYYNNIQSSITHPTQKHFVTAGYKWRCNQAILKEITEIDLHGTELILYTSHATLTDIFEELSLLYETNANHQPYEVLDIGKGNRRRLQSSFMANLWSEAIHGISTVIDFIKNVIHSLDIPSIKKVVGGESIQVGPKNMTKTWGWNYEGDQVTKHIKIAPNVSCKHCSAHLDVVYRYQLNIAQYALQYLRVSLEGNASITGGIRMNGSSINRTEYRQNTAPFSIFAFEAAGVLFEADIYGQMGIGCHGDIAAFSFNMGVTGYIQKGIEYNRSARNQYNYINQHSFDFNESFPHGSLQQGEITTYMRPTLYLQLKYIGSLFFGFQPSFRFKFTLGADTKCVVQYAPSAKINDFIGAKLSNYMVHWRKSLDFAQHQTNLNNWGGCMDKKQVTRSQIWQKTLNLFGGRDDKRRRMTTYEIPTIQEAVTYVNYSNEHLIPRFAGRNNKMFVSEYWGNLSTVPSICSDYSDICQGFMTQAIIPRIAQLMMSIENDTLFGIYRTIIEISPANNWPFLNTSIVSNVSCLARHQFDVLPDLLNDAFKVTLLEWYCDTDLIDFGINKSSNPRHYALWQCMISLPSFMYSISPDASFSTMVLFDAPNWCHVFPLSTKQQYILDANDREAQLNWSTIYYPAYPLWYGVWGCSVVLNQTQKDSTLYFVSYDENTTQTEVIMQLDEDATIYLQGKLDFAQLIMDLDAVYWYEQKTYFKEMNELSLHFHGFLRILSDKSIIYAGSVDHEGCSGFLFHGYANLEALSDEQLYVDDDSARIPQLIVKQANNSFVSSKSVIMFFIGMSSAFLIMAIAVLCLRLRLRKRRKLHRYRLMNDDKL